MLTIIGLIILGIFGFCLLGVLGWIIKLFGYIFDFLLEGFFKSLGCLFWVAIIIIILMAMCCPEM